MVGDKNVEFGTMVKFVPKWMCQAALVGKNGVEASIE